MDSNKKGARHENEAKDILSRVYGGGVEKVDAYSNHDPFGFVDLIAMKPGEPVFFVQVKTNEFTAADKRKYRKRVDLRLPKSNAIFQVWLRIDRQGWERWALEEGAFVMVQDIPHCDTEKAREQYAESVGHVE